MSNISQTFRTYVGVYLTLPQQGWAVEEGFIDKM
jgi:hypothetical protein